ncbi:hypothetical protein WR25_06185 isoform M [Diploscapter pachys]|uniref:SLC26A/SulP transporter domain-containing protein n=1 Tax=Diploscapter pachys TaxID=2018661 RepID=A0A2A2LTA3_9BILA|nr:hypothetical protein WR25_06185 isoform M [Diploscapter pachys]
MSQEQYDEKYGIDEEENHAFVDKFKRNLLVGDIVGGITTGIIHIPQGIAYAGLNGVDPVYGLYVSFFPVLFYMFFGTSRHASVGSFAVLSLMAKDAGEKIMENFRSDALPPPTPIETATMLTFCMGIWQLLCGIFRLQFIVSYFSDSLISGFTTGAGCHVLVAQFDNLIGVTTHNSSSFFYIFERVLRIPSQIEHVNVYTCIISVLSIIFLEIGKDIISPWLAKKHNFKFPLPYDLILIIISAAASIILQFNLNYGIRVVGEIPEGMPSPILPNFSIFLPSLIHSIPLAVVTIAVHIAMAKMLAKDVGYQLDDHQEFYALGLTSMLSALFPLYPMSTGVGRTIASIKAGTNTQLSSLFCSGLLFLVILKIGSYLEQLPKVKMSHTLNFKEFSVRIVSNNRYRIIVTVQEER